MEVLAYAEINMFTNFHLKTPFGLATTVPRLKSTLYAENHPYKVQVEYLKIYNYYM